MVVLLAALITAFFSNSLLQHKISVSSANQTKVEIFAHGAAKMVIADLRQEIAAESTPITVTTGTVTTTLYRPTTFANMVPSRQSLVDNGLISSATSLPNLVAISSAGPLYPTGISRGSSDLTTGTSLNGRSISMARWNQVLLLPKNDPASTNPAPVTTSFPSDGSKAPHWILVARNGSNPTAWSTNLRNGSGATEVLGRYAYMIYNEGGLLDANVAGGPSAGTSGSQQFLWSRKGSVAFADLTQLPGFSDLSSARAQQIIDQMAGWRNYTSIQPSGILPDYNIGSSGIMNYLNYAIASANDLIVGGTSMYQNRSDQRFVSRQQLIRFLTQGVVTNASESAQMQNALQYLGTFSRTLNQPYCWPDPNKRTVVLGWNGSSYAGGNSSYGSDIGKNPPYVGIYNPPFQAMRVTVSGTRNNGAPMMIGEPLVKERFALTKLLWLTYKGPSANLLVSDPLYQQYLNLGMPPGQLAQMWQEGTPANIYKYFGLTWNQGPGPGGLGGYWLYNHGISSGGATLLASLSDVQSAGREPDFFELLKAAVNVGAIAKARTGIGTGGQTGNYYPIKDSTVTFQILQLGANIIDQANPTQYCTTIKYNYGDSGGYLRAFYGSMDLPYLYSLNKICFISAVATPAPSATNYMTANPNQDILTNNGVTVTQSGTIAALIVPVIWNPYDGSSPLNPPSASGLAPTQFRITLIGAALTDTTQSVSQWNYTPRSSISGSIASYGNLASNWTSENSTALTFSNPGSSTLFREPTVLIQNGVPAGSNLAMGSGNIIAGVYSSEGIPEAGSGGKYIGFLMGSFPQRWTVASGTVGTTYTVNNLLLGHPSTAMTLRLEYQTSGTWVPYSEVYLDGDNNEMYVPVKEDGSASYPYLLSPVDASTNSYQSLWRNNSINWYGTYFFDPRTSRWGCPSIKPGPPFIDSANNVVMSERPAGAADLNSIGVGFGGSVAGQGWYDVPGGFGLHLGGPTQNLNTSLQCYYTDPDQIGRRAMGALAGWSPGMPSNPTPASITGLPMATPASVSSRPVFLHRPYRTVSELGYVFSDTPWRNIDFFTPESGYSALLDVFCINENSNPNSIIQGKVDLNSLQAPVFNAILSGAYRDELGGSSSVLTTSEISAIASALVARSSNTAVNQGPLSNIADLVGRYIQSGYQNPNANFQPYDGFSGDLPGLYSSGSAANNVVQRFMESAIRPLADAGQAGTWNLLIDLVAQVGGYPDSANNLSDFMVDGEIRYWIHMAIDRQTGKIIDQQVEKVEQ
jgi:hypothetical protein